VKCNDDNFFQANSLNEESGVESVVDVNLYDISWKVTNNETGEEITDIPIYESDEGVSVDFTGKCNDNTGKSLEMTMTLKSDPNSSFTTNIDMKTPPTMKKGKLNVGDVKAEGGKGKKLDLDFASYDDA